MELSKELKEKVEQTESKEEAKKTIAEVKMELTDEEMDQVSGGLAYKAVNSALTELDEEGIDVGGTYVIQWTGEKWGCP